MKTYHVRKIHRLVRMIRIFRNLFGPFLTTRPSANPSLKAVDRFLQRTRREWGCRASRCGLVSIVLFEDVIFVFARDMSAPKTGLAKLIIGRTIGFVLKATKVFRSARGTTETIMNYGFCVNDSKKGVK